MRLRELTWLFLLVGLGFLAGACAPGSGPEEASAGAADADADADAARASSSGVPSFEVDPTWPQPMPDKWIIGSVTGVFVDANDHVWVTQLPETLTDEEIAAAKEPPLATCCVPAPTVIEYDAQGKVVQGWGDTSQDISIYPRNPHGIFVDHNDFVWIGTFRHHRVMKFTRSGEHVMTIGKYDENAGSDSKELLGGPAGIYVDPTTNEVFIADGYRNRRVVVFNGETGEYLRHWGAYGEPPDDDYEYDYASRTAEDEPPRQFSTVHGLAGSKDGMIYVADRRGNRIQSFRQNGEFVMERTIEPTTRLSGSAFVIVLSPDPEQQWLYLADGTNHKVWILRRENLEVVDSFGQGGHYVGQFLRPHGMSIDSHGNLYVGEASTGRRVQKFTLR